MENKLTQLILCFFISLYCSGQSQIDFEQAMDDTLYLREFTTEYPPLLKCIDQALQFGDLGSLLEDELYLLTIDSSISYTPLYKETSNPDFYITISKNKKSNVYKYQNTKIGYCIYKGKIFFLKLDYDYNNHFIPTGQQTPFVFIDMEKMFKKYKSYELGDFFVSLSIVYYKFIGDNFEYCYGMYPSK